SGSRTPFSKSILGVSTSLTSLVPASLRLCGTKRYDRSTVRMPDALTPSCVPVTRKQLAEPQVARAAEPEPRAAGSARLPHIKRRGLKRMRVPPVVRGGGRGPRAGGRLDESGGSFD